MSKVRKVGVLLSGCGHLDGAEIRESVFTLLALDKVGVEALVMAPNIDQYHVINHLTGEEEEQQSRNVLTEAARIARGKVVDITSVNPKDIDALIIPGGFGAAKNLCDFASKGAEGQVHPLIKDFVTKVYLYNIPIGAICIAPAVLALLFGHDRVELTIGNDLQTTEELEKTGAKIFKNSVTEIHTDKERRIITTPAYMFEGATMNQVYTGIERLVHKTLEVI